MATNAEQAHEKYQAAIGEAEGAGEWLEIDQARIDQFADVTEDHQFIHVDPEAAKATPFGTTIAHGFLTLSMLTKLSSSIPQDTSRFHGVVMGVNYGFDRVRFVAPVKVGSRVRATSTLKEAKLKDAATIDVTRTMTVEIEGEDKPALVADWITRLVYG